MPSSTDIRRQFIDFFATRHGHTFVPSGPVVPHDDPTLLFTNAGMNQFKPYFLGTEKPPFRRVVNSQKCIRAGGKHNDLDDVGRDTYHHTFFEMLGNWSFGDYFKADAIAWAWELLTGVWKLDPARLHVTVFEGDAAAGIPRDDEAADLWKQVGVRPGHVHLGNAKDNFWEMGETGPCGPCTEVHYDHTPDASGGPLVNGGTDRVIEIWNLVFIQFNRNADRTLTPLPAKHVDTGMGFERITKVLQGKASNYDTDIFTPILDGLAALTGRQYGGLPTDPADVGFRVIADHLRMATFAVADGARPGAKKREAVLRSVIRRAVRYGYMRFDRREPFLFSLVPIVVEQMQAAFPELARDPAGVMDVIRQEERDFFRTVAGGIKRFEAAVAGMAGTFDGPTAFDLLQTFGFPEDMTVQMAAERGLAFDAAGFDAADERHRAKSREGLQAHFNLVGPTGEMPSTNDNQKYEGLVGSGEIRLFFGGGDSVIRDTAPITAEYGEVAVLLDRTNFYTEQGGQVGDQGIIETQTGSFHVTKVNKIQNSVLHQGVVTQGSMQVGQIAKLVLDERRLDIMRNHTATHLLNLALRQVLGGHVEQRGSLVDGEKTRFDFSHDKPLTTGEMREVEARVNTLAGQDLPVTAEVIPLAEAKQIAGVRAVFGEKYPDPVRVVLIGPDTPAAATAGDSVEFCGGTHLARTGGIGLFKLLSQEGVAKGVRRVTAVTGRRAVAAVRELTAMIDDLTAQLQCKPADLPGRVAAMQEELKKLQHQAKKGQAADLAGVVDRLLAAAPEVNGSKLVVGELPGATVDLARVQLDRVRQMHPSALVVFAWVDDAGKVPVIVALTADLVKRGLKAGDLLKPVAAVVGGKGGGKPEYAQAGGVDAAKLPEALATAARLGRGMLGGP